MSHVKHRLWMRPFPSNARIRGDPFAFCDEMELVSVQRLKRLLYAAGPGHLQGIGFGGFSQLKKDARIVGREISGAAARICHLRSSTRLHCKFCTIAVSVRPHSLKAHSDPVVWRRRLVAQ